MTCPHGLRPHRCATCKRARIERAKQTDTTAHDAADDEYEAATAGTAPLPTWREVAWSEPDLR